uniref:Uncharacterized protein n=1 Tax=Arundo donax TaxID=35708 RepID=A0A0A8Z7K6_ARUDO
MLNAPGCTILRNRFRNLQRHGVGVSAVLQLPKGRQVPYVTKANFSWVDGVLQ